MKVSGQRVNCQQAFDAFDVSRSEVTQTLRQPRCRRQTDRNSLAVEIDAVPSHLLNRVAKRMAQVQERASTFSRCFSLIRGDDRCLQLTTASYHLGQVGARHGQRLTFELLEQMLVPQQSVFDDFSHTRGEFP